MLNKSVNAVLFKNIIEMMVWNRERILCPPFQLRDDDYNKLIYFKGKIAEMLQEQETENNLRSSANHWQFFCTNKSCKTTSLNPDLLEKTFGTNGAQNQDVGV